MKTNVKRERVSASRLTDLRRGSYASARATERILCDARAKGIPSAVSRTSQWRARKERASRMTPFGKLVDEFVIPTPAGDITIAAQHPMAMVYTSYVECEPFRKMFRRTIDKYPPTPSAPWRIAMYCDEVGHNPVGRDNRKCEAIYWSFLEFGPRVLHTEDAWFEVMAVRTGVVAQIPGFMSGLFKIILNRLFFGDVGNFSTGCLMPDCILLYAEFSCLVADEKALKEILCAKGASGLKFCPICYEICDHKATDARATGCIRSTCLDVDTYKHHTDASVKAVLSELRRQHQSFMRGEISKNAYSEQTIFYGWNYDENSLLFCPRLRVGAISTLMHDWAHMYVVSGLFNVEVQYLMIALNASGIPPSQLSAFIQKWVWPRHMANPYDMFCAKRVDLTGDHYKCEAHEALLIYGVIAIFLDTLPANVCLAAIASFKALADV